MNDTEILNLFQSQNDKIEELSEQIDEMNMKLQDADVYFKNKQKDLDDIFKRSTNMLHKIIQLKDNIEFKYSTDVDIDSHRGLNKIITIGTYKNQDYVQIHVAEPNDFNHLVDMLRSMSKRCSIGRIDAPIQLKQPIKDMMEYT